MVAITACYPPRASTGVPSGTRWASLSVPKVIIPVLTNFNYPNRIRFNNFRQQFNKFPQVEASLLAFDLLTTFERRQRLLALLQQQPGIRVPELASLLGVSQGTIRYDFNALAESGQLTRVRGGAALPDGMDVQSLAFAARAHTNELAKLRIARGAAELVEDGDAILIDASTTAFHIAPFLDENRNLTVVTNGIDAARRLAKNPSNTVILLGGVVREDGSRVSGPLSEVPLADLHIKTAFVSGTGFSLEAGLTEVDIDEA